jgi:hypothetical protein
VNKLIETLMLGAAYVTTAWTGFLSRWILTIRSTASMTSIGFLPLSAPPAVKVRIGRSTGRLKLEFLANAY